MDKNRLRIIRFFLLSGIVCLLTAALFVRGTEARAAGNEFVPLWGPYITGTESGEVVINWKTSVPSKGILQYVPETGDISEGDSAHILVSDTVQQLHRVTITGLFPGMKYRYRVWEADAEADIDSLPAGNGLLLRQWLTDNAKPTPVFQFTAPGGESFTFAVYGDSQEQEAWFSQMERHRLVAERVAEENADFVVYLGDFIYDAENVEGWDGFFEAGRTMLANTVLYTVMGNHEAYSPVYFGNFGLPAYYRFTWGTAGFTVLDTNYRADYELQATWLANELSASKCREFVFYHHPAYTTDDRNYGGWQQPREYWEDIFVENGVNAVFSGHVHAYERYKIRGIDYLVAGTGGGMLTELRAEYPPESQNRLEHTLGFLRVTVKADRVTADFIKVAKISEDNRTIEEIYPAGSVFETFTIQENPAAFETDEESSLLVTVIICLLALNIIGVGGYVFYKNRIMKSKVMVNDETGN